MVGLDGLVSEIRGELTSWGWYLLFPGFFKSNFKVVGLGISEPSTVFVEDILPLRTPSDLTVNDFWEVPKQIIWIYGEMVMRKNSSKLQENMALAFSKDLASSRSRGLCLWGEWSGCRRIGGAVPGATSSHRQGTLGTKWWEREREGMMLCVGSFFFGRHTKSSKSECVFFSLGVLFFVVYYVYFVVVFPRSFKIVLPVSLPHKPKIDLSHKLLLEVPHVPWQHVASYICRS